MPLVYSSAAAHRLVSDIQVNNSRLATVGNAMIRCKSLPGWNDSKRDAFVNAVNAALIAVGTAINCQNSYMSQLGKAIAVLEE